MARIIQLNVNHSGPSQDNLLQLMEELNAGLAVVAEPHRIPRGNPKWIHSVEDPPLTAIIWRKCENLFLPPQTLERGRGYCMIRWNELRIVSCYISPNSTIRQFNNYLDELQLVTNGYLGSPILILGDFNAHNREWGGKVTDTRGRLLKEWLDNLGLFVMNSEGVPTCVRPQGNSIVDLCIGNASAQSRIFSLEVSVDIVTVSDHRAIIIDLIATEAANRFTKINAVFPRWNYKKLNTDMMNAAAIFGSWAMEARGECDANERADRLDRTLKDISDISMPRSKGFRRVSAYWWSEELASTRAVVVKERRAWTRAKKRGDQVVVAGRYATYRLALGKYRLDIKRSKNKAWKELLNNIDDDPWGVPYKLVLNKLRPVTHPVSETLPCELVKHMVNILFPVNKEEENSRGELNPFVWQEEYSVSRAEVRSAMSKFRKDKKAPGPDGIVGGIVSGSGGPLMDMWAECFTRCLREGMFPDSWKVARLVLLKKKEGDPADPGIYRPICLLNEAGKLFERVIVDRINRHLKEANALSKDQYGFRAGHSTIDAILRLRNFVESHTTEGRVVVAVSIDIANAFNSLPWKVIRNAMVKMEFPSYLCRAVSAYLRNRRLLYLDCFGNCVTRRLSCGVPQGSVLGPTLWNIGYNEILDSDLSADCGIFCYADDTVVLSAGQDYEEAAHSVMVASYTIINRIEKLGLRVAPNKTEVMVFPARAYKRNRYINIKGNDVEVQNKMKYLGVVIDGSWNFQAHFEMIAAKVEKTVGHLHRLMPNIKGPSEHKRKLYASVVFSILLYGAPVWWNSLGDRVISNRLNNITRRIAQRVCRTYRTVSCTAALLLAGIPKLEITARRLARAFVRVRTVERERGPLEWRAREKINVEMKARSLRTWKRALLQMGRNDSGLRIRLAITPVLVEWCERGHGMMTYHMSQMMTGHGCFNAFLHRIRKVDSPACAHCEEEFDDAQHTLEYCPEWREWRTDLMMAIGPDLSLVVIVRQILTDRLKWQAFAAFCGEVLTRKEAAERNRQAQDRRPRIGHLDSDVSDN